MAAAVLAAARRFQELFNADSYAGRGIISIPYYRGGAVGIVQDSTGVGTLSKVMDGSVMNHFMGVVKADKTTSATATGTDLLIALKRDGAVAFNAVEGLVGAETDAAPVYSTWLGKPVFFRSDNHVALTPNEGTGYKYYQYAGRVIATPDMAGYDGLGSAEVLVEIDDAVRGFGPPRCNWSFAFDPTASSGTALNICAFTPARRVWVTRVVAHIGLAIGTATVINLVLKNGSTSVMAAAALGAVTLGTAIALYPNAASLFDYNDVLNIETSSTGDAASGLITVNVEYLDLSC